MSAKKYIQSLKELSKHLLFKTGQIQHLNTYRRKRGLKTAHLDAGRTTQERFEDIYEQGVWKQSLDHRSLSGAGSEMSATSDLREQLPKLLSDLGACSLLDVGCGDWNWAKHIEFPCRYIGIDIVRAVIEANQEHARDNVEFILCDAISSQIPKADVAICREVLFHLSLSDAFAVIQNIKKSASFLIATTDDILFNSDIMTGDFRCLNLQRAPFRFPQPVLWIQDEAVCHGRKLGVWDTKDLP